eukprot:s233_g17.t1
MTSESFMVTARRPRYFNAEQFRTDTKCTDNSVVLGGWELESKRWFSLKLSRDEIPFLFKPDGGGSQCASTSAELLASLAALTAFGWFDTGSQRRTMALSLCAGTDNLANDLLSSKRSRWRPREENVEADQLTHEIFAPFSPSQRVDLKFSDLDLDLLMMLWQTKAQFDLARQEAKQAALAGPPARKRKYEKTAW